MFLASLITRDFGYSLTITRDLTITGEFGYRLTIMEELFGKFIFLGHCFSLICGPSKSRTIVCGIAEFAPTGCCHSLYQYQDELKFHPYFQVEVYPILSKSDFRFQGVSWLVFVCPRHDVHYIRVKISNCIVCILHPMFVVMRESIRRVRCVSCVSNIL